MVDIRKFTCGSRIAPGILPPAKFAHPCAAPQVGVLSLACPRESAQREDTPDGADGFCAPLPLGPSPNHSASMHCGSGADLLSAPLTGSPQRPRCSKPRHTGTQQQKPISIS